MIDCKCGKEYVLLIEERLIILGVVRMVLEINDDLLMTL